MTPPNEQPHVDRGLGWAAYEARPHHLQPPKPPVARKVAAWVVVVGLAAGIGVLIYILGRPEAPASGPGDDARVAVMLQENETHEARGWLAASRSRMVMGWTHEESAEAVRRLYEQGAPRVLAVGNAAATADLIVELPTARANPAGRRAIFLLHEQWDMVARQAPPKDVGQQYLIVHPMTRR
jgi:hypothetical protein